MTTTGILRRAPWAFLAAVSLWVTSCADARGTPPARAVEPSAPVTAQPAAPEGVSEAKEGASDSERSELACLSSDECPNGACEGEGCGEDAPGHCVLLVRPCTKDLATYCGCDGRTFRGSGSCPGRRYAHRGACREAQPSEAP